MRIGVVLLPTDGWPETVAAARRIEELGYAHLWVYDHLSWRRYRDRPWHATHPWLTGVAVATERIRLGTMVSNPNIRHPATLAKDAMTIDHISEGRLTLGLGAGGLGFDTTVLGAEPLSPGQRVDRLSEFAHCLDGLLNGQLRSHRGEYYAFEEVRLLPGRVQQPRLPLAVAAGGRRTLAVAAAIGDAWVSNGDPDPDATAAGTEQLARQHAELLDEQCAAAGRDPASIDRIFMITNRPERPLSSVEAFTDFIGRYAALGFTDVVFHHPRPDDPVWDDPPEIVEQIAHLSVG